MWTTILTSIIPSLVQTLMQTTAAAPTTVSVPAVGAKPATTLTVGPSAAVKALQHLLNQTVKPTPLLVEDGWLGAKTEAAINQGIAMAKPYLAFIGVTA